MEPDKAAQSAFVIKVEELAALNYLAADHPRPLRVEWINRGTDQVLKASSVDMLMRTLFEEAGSPSVEGLHHSTGLRAIFDSEEKRALFARALEEAKQREASQMSHLVTAIFNQREEAERAVQQLKSAGVADNSISLMWKASQFMDTANTWHEGHGALSIASAAAGSGIAGAILGIAILTIPGVGPVAAAGAIAASAFSSVAAVSGVIGATGGAIARMLTDHDVDGVSANFYAQQVGRGKVFLSVDPRIAGIEDEVIQQILQRNGGRSARRMDNSSLPQ